MKIYRLLRNNKETGPYSTDELITMGLKQYDLIWADGKSAAWRYPGEIPELKDFAPAVLEQPFDRFYKKPAPQKNTAITKKKEETIAIISPKKAKPKIRITADWNQIEDKKIISPEGPVAEKKVNIDWEDAWLNWEHEKKIADMNSKKQIEDEIKECIKEPLLETKYSASLDDIKMQYMENLLQAKKKITLFSFTTLSKYALPTAAILIIICGAFWLMGKWENKHENKPVAATTLLQQHISTNTEKNEAAQPNNNSSYTATLEKENASVKHQKQNDQVTFIAVTKKEKQPANTMIQYKKTVAKSKSPVVANENETAASPVVVPSNTNNKTVENPLPTKKSADEKTVNDFVKVSPSATLSTNGAEIKVNNTSDIAFDLVVIDLQYYDLNNHYKKGETLYIKNLQANKSIVVKAPADNASSVVKSHIAILSSDAKNIYMVGE